MKFENYVFDESRYAPPKSVFTKKMETDQWKWGKREYKKPEEYVYLGKNELMWGASTRDFEDAVVTEYNPNRRITIAICSGQGLGKSILVKNTAIDQLHYRYRHPILAIAPKPADFHRITQKNREHDFINLLAKYKITPKAYHAKFVVPKFMDLMGSYGKKSGNEITLCLKDLKQMDKDTRTAMMCKLLGDTKTADAGYKVISGVMMRDDMPIDVDEFMERLDEEIQKYKSKPENVKTLFKNLIDTGKISNEHFDYSREMVKHGIVVLEGSQASEDTFQGLSQGIFVNSAINNVIYGRKSGVFKKIPIILMEEANNYANKNGGTCSASMTAISTQYREVGSQAGISSIVVSQFLHELAPKIISEAEYIVCSKITNKLDLEILNKRDCDTSVMWNLHSSFTEKPNEWVIYGRNGLDDHQTFFPLPTASSMISA